MSAAWKHSTGQKIERIYAWIATEADGGEGICSTMIGNMQMPMVGADRERVESLRPHAAALARELKIPVKLKLFSNGVVLDEI